VALSLAGKFRVPLASCQCLELRFGPVSFSGYKGREFYNFAEFLLNINVISDTVIVFIIRVTGAKCRV
ncbi:MAG: hypothetical protein WD045_07950, partial [Pirellulaceae bacterium]